MRDIHHRNTRNIVPLGIRIAVSDLEKSHRWYKETLGLHMEMADDGQSSAHEIELPDGTKEPVFWLVPETIPGTPDPATSLVCHVGVLGKIVSDLREAGVMIESEPTLRPGTAVPSAVIRDPDGHRIVLIGD